jgi:hypothetical protein
MPVSATRAVDIDALIDGARAALLANSTIAAALDTAHQPGRIANEMVAQGTTPPYIVLALASTVYESAYQEPTINALMDVSCYTQGASTTLVRQLVTTCVSALVDTAWTATGFALWSVNMEEGGSGMRSITSVDSSGVITRGRQITLRIRAAKV